MPIFNFRNPIEYPLGLLELLTSGATGAAGQVAGVPIGLLKSADKYGTQEGVREAEKEAQRVSSALTYLPRTETAREMASLLGKAVDASKLPPVMPEAQSLLAMSSMPKQMYVAQGMNIEKAAEPVVRQIMERGGMPASLLEGMSSRTVSPLTVYHGSPHKFERFDPTKIGTGEGAQAYGRGLYMTESQDIAKGYQPRDMAYENKLLSAYNKAEKSGDYASAQILEEFLTQKTPEQVAETLKDFSGKELKNAQSAFDFAKKAFQGQKGSYIYKVDLPDEQIAKMIDWDKPLKEQSSEIRALAKQYGLTDADHLGGDLIAAMGAKEAAGAEAMRKAGIPGVRYIDESSRGGNKGASNFVIFPGNEDLITILERNSGLLGP